MKLNPINYRRGVTLMEVLAIIAVIVLVVALLLPALANGRRRTSRIGCINNVKQVQLAFMTWSLDNSDRFPMQVSTTDGGSMEFVAGGHTFPHFQVISNEISTPKLLNCPVDNRMFAANFQNDFTDSNISYFVGLDASSTNPASFLIGDSHFAIGGVPVKSGLLLLSTDTSVGWTSARHDGRGNIALADGSVHLVNSSELRKLTAETRLATNRISIP